jgi:hypothetical protein
MVLFLEERLAGHGQKIVSERPMLRYSADAVRCLGLCIVRDRIFADRNCVQCANRQPPRFHS